MNHPHSLMCARLVTSDGYFQYLTVSVSSGTIPPPPGWMCVSTVGACLSEAHACAHVHTSFSSVNVGHRKKKKNHTHTVMQMRFMRTQKVKDTLRLGLNRVLVGASCVISVSNEPAAGHFTIVQHTHACPFAALILKEQTRRPVSPPPRGVYVKHVHVSVDAANAD